MCVHKKKGACAVMPALKMRFTSFNEWDSFLKECQVTSKQYFTMLRSKTLQSGPKKTANCNKDIKYYSVKYACKFGPQRPTESLGYRKSTTFKADCHAYIALKCTEKNGEWALEIEELDLTHKNHDHSEHIIHLIPENRKMQPELIDETISALSSRSNKKIVQSVLHAKGCNITLKDLHNMASKLRTKNGDDLESAVKLLTDQYGARVSIAHQDKDFQGLFFATEDMINSVKKYPEIVGMDGTYKLLKINLTVVIFLLVDSNGFSEVGGIGLLASEQKQILRWLLDNFKKMNDNPEVKCFITDKDLKEREIIKEIFPGVTTYLCQFHVLQTFARVFANDKYHLIKKKREAVLEVLQSLVYSSSPAEYDQNYVQLKKIATQAFMEYYDKNWNPIKEEWVTCYMNKCNFNIVTNNRLESMNAKIKQVIQKNSSLNDFIVHFFIWLQSKNFETDAKITYSMYKKPFSNESDDSVLAYRNLLTNFAFNLINKELKAASSNDQAKQLNLKATPENCTCPFYTANKLPCRHIFVLRKDSGLPLFSESLCDKRWKQEFVIENQRTFKHALVKDDVDSKSNDEKKKNLDKKLIKLTNIEKKTVKSVPDKIRILTSHCNNLITTGSLSCYEKFDEKVKLLRDLDKLWRGGKTGRLVDDENLWEQFQKLHLQDTENTPPSKNIEQTSSLTEIELPKAIKIRGNPKENKKTCNKKFVKKRSFPVDIEK